MKKQSIFRQKIRLEQEAVDAASLMKRVDAFLENRPIPDAYYSSGVYGINKDHPHPHNRLNINDLLGFFNCLACEEGYELDYIYVNKGFSAFPKLYVRPADIRYLEDINKTEAELSNSARWSLDHLQFELIPMGYLQLVLFSIMCDQFYRFWHANYDDKRMVLCLPDALSICIDLNTKDDEIDYADEVNRLDFTPRLVIFPDWSAILSAHTFSKWHGFRQLDWMIYPPAFIETAHSETVIPYDCEVEL
jgi:hypothetical protein